jgi:uncharacterized protein DUF4397
MSRWSKTLPPALALAALCIVAVSCNTGNTTQARFVNALQDTVQYGTALDINFNGNKYFSDIGFQEYLPATGYTTVPAGGSTVAALETGTSTQISSNNIFLNPGSRYTMVLTGFATNDADVALISALDTTTTPSTGKVEFRVIHASPSAPSGLDVYIVPIGSSGSLAPPATITNLAYPSASKYVTLDYNSNRANGANYTIFVTATGTTSPILLTQSLSAGTLGMGAIRTVILTDQQNIDQLNPLVIVLNDFN